MEINVADLRKKPQINWQVPFEWMSKLSNDDIMLWEKEAMDLIRESIKDENRPTSYDESWNRQKVEEEVKARVRDLAKLIEIDYKKMTF